ncbi:hypothetical protein KI387_008896, partial [Taxus chinensis]
VDGYEPLLFEAGSSPGRVFKSNLSRPGKDFLKTNIVEDERREVKNILQSVVMKNHMIGHTRGFGFVVLFDPNILDSVLQGNHTIDGRA